MKRKLTEIFVVIGIVCFSFYYTDRAVDIVRENDPMMKELMEKSKDYEILSKDATFTDKGIIPGLSGKQVDLKKSFENMKKYGGFKESLLVFEEVKPGVSLEEYYDRYVIRGNALKNSVSLVFKVSANDDVSKILSVLNEKNARGTFFIDGKYLEQNQEMVYQLARDDHEVEIMSYDGGYSKKKMQESFDLLEMVLNQHSGFCYAEYDQKEVLELCSKEQRHTIIPNAIVSNYPFSTVKGYLDKGNIISFSINSQVEEELPIIINYIQQRGYQMMRLDDLLRESTYEK